MIFALGRVAQSVTCLTEDTCLTTDPGVTSLIPVDSILSWRLIMKSFLQPISSFPLTQEGLLPHSQACPGKSVVR